MCGVRSQEIEDRVLPVAETTGKEEAGYEAKEIGAWKDVPVVLSCPGRRSVRLGRCPLFGSGVWGAPCVCNSSNLKTATCGRDLRESRLELNQFA